MATIKVSGQSQLLSALKTAKAGDTLSLAGGNYGNVTLPSAANKGNLTITSASDSNPAVFQTLVAKKVNGLTIDDLKFVGKSATGGIGLTIANSTNIKVTDSDFSHSRVGSFIYEITGLTMSGNSFTKLYHDAMTFADITNGTISRNVYRESGSQPGYTHKDFIQFWTNKQYDQAPSKNIMINNNSFYSQDGDTHGIFILNEADTAKYQNIDIVNNYIKASQTHGITVDYANDVLIQNNTLIKDGKGAPVINVAPDATNVKILNNTAPSVADRGNSSWTVSGNKETLPNAYQWTDGKTGQLIKNSGGSSGASSSSAASADSAASSSSSSSATSSTASSSASSDLGNGHADEFRFDGNTLKGGATAKASAIDFSEGDTLVLINYDNGTIKDVDGGNLVWHNLAGSYVKIDSLADIHEIVDASPKIAASVSGDTLTLDITQNDGLHHLQLAGLGQEYSALF